MNSPEDKTQADNPWRSKKYAKMSDKEILDLSLQKLNDKDRYFLAQELDQRGLTTAANQTKLEVTKKEMRAKPWWKYIPLVFALLFLMKQLAGK